MDVGNMPVKHTVSNILLHIHILLQELHVSKTVTHVYGNCNIFKRLEFKIILVLVVLDLHGDNVLALLLGVEHIDCERQVLFRLARVPVSKCVESCLSRDAFSALLS